MEHDGMITVGSGIASRAIAYRNDPATGTNAWSILWLNGYRSSMFGEKATAIAKEAQRAGDQFLRFDYSGTGASGGDFAQGGIERWLEEAIALLPLVTESRLLLIGSSLGGWLALLLAKYLEQKSYPFQLSGGILIAPAVDYTERLIRPSLTQEEQRELEKSGVIYRASEYEQSGMPYYRAFLEEAMGYQLLQSPFTLDAPFKVIYGRKDDVIPLDLILKLTAQCNSIYEVGLRPNGDHRLSTEDDLSYLIESIKQVKRWVSNY